MSSTPTFARQLLVPALPGFTAAHPQVELELTLSVPLLAEGDAGADVRLCADDDPRNVAIMRSLGIPTLAIPSGYYDDRDRGTVEYR